MKRKGISLIWCALALLFSAPVIAQDKVTATILPTEVGDEWTLELNLENPDESRYTAFQLDINLPEGFSIVDHTAATSTRLPDHSLVVSCMNGSTYKVGAYSMTNTAIVGNSGCIASMTLLADETVELGAYSGALSNIRVSTRAAEEVELSDYSFSWEFKNKVSIYTVTYWVDGQVFTSQNYKEGASIFLADVPEKEGHTFTGWANLPECMPGEDIHVEAVFAVNTYKITYLLDGEVYAEDSVEYGAVIVPLQVVEDEIFTFSGWSNIPEVMPAYDIIVSGTTTLTTIHMSTVSERAFDVYALSGKLVAQKVTLAWVKNNLTKGVYIINGRKIVIQ